MSRPSISRSQSSSRTGTSPSTSSRRVFPGHTSLDRSRTSRSIAPGVRQSESNRSRYAGTGLGSRRDTRKVTGPLSRDSRIQSPGRDLRKAGSPIAYPYTRRSYYHYHRESYPSRRIFHWISWPNCCRPICYTGGPYCTFGFFWPYYHRKFVFISLGGYWPCYTYRRYYWYGWHPYTWYGYYPPEYVTVGDTYNYYSYYDRVSPDHEALDEAGKKLEESAPAGPDEKTQADSYFEEAVKVFEAGDYAAAAAKFHAAMELAPDDVVLPFAYVQALFATGEYGKAADALREVLAKTSPEKEGVFYPRGLYPADDLLQKHIKQLEENAASNPLDADLQLLLGYQLLGIGRLDEAAKPLANARLDYNNYQAATRLLGLLEKLKKADGKSEGSNKQEMTQPDDGQPAKPEVEAAEPTVLRNPDAQVEKTGQDVDFGALALFAENWLSEQQPVLAQAEHK